MPFGTTTYSPVDLTGAINSPLAGPFILSGASLGRGKIVVTMDHEWTEEDVALDGAADALAGEAGWGVVHVAIRRLIVRR